MISLFNLNVNMTANRYVTVEHDGLKEPLRQTSCYGAGIEMANQNAWNQGHQDSQNGKGPQDPNSFNSSQKREDYYAGYNSGKK